MPSGTVVKSSAKPEHIAEIERLQFKWVEVAQFDLDRIDPDRRVQVRDADNYARPDEVDSYAQQMGQVAFPAIVMTEDDYLVDGNTRWRAAKKRKDKFFPAIIIREAYATADEKRQFEFGALAATLNNLNGRRQTKKEMRRFVAECVRWGWRADQIQRVLGAEPGDIRQVKWEVDAHARLAVVGLSNGQVRASGASLRALGKPVVLALNHAPYRELAQLAMDAGLNAREIGELAREAKATGSDEGAMLRIREVRAEQAERIRQHDFEDGQSKPPAARRLRQVLGQITKYEGKEAELVETSAYNYDNHILALELSVRVLTDVLQLQHARVNAPITEADTDDTDDDEDDE